MRIEPPPSLAWAIGNIPPATAAEAPPEEPPEARPVSQGLTRVAVARVLGHGERAELGRVGAAAEDEAGALQRLDHQLALLAELIAGAVGAIGEWPACDRGQVLDRDRHAEERRLLPAGDPRVGVPSGRTSRLVVTPDDRVQLGIALVDRGEASVEQLDRGELARAKRSCQLNRGRSRSEAPPWRVIVTAYCALALASSACLTFSTPRSIISPVISAISFGSRSAIQTNRVVPSPLSITCAAPL